MAKTEARDPKRFPIHSSDRKIIESVPWGLVAPFERQALSNHSQTLQRLSERGGLGLEELWCVLNEKSLRFYRTVTSEQAADFIRKAVAEHEAQL